MKTIADFLLKVIVKQFYIINAGFLFFVFFVFFGMVNGAQLISYHQSLILAMISSPVFMGIVWAAWLFYNIKCILFCSNSVKAANSTYIYSLRGLSNLKQLLLYLLVSTFLYMPVLIYACFVVYMAAAKTMWLTALLVAAYQLLMIALAAWAFFFTINKNNQVSTLEIIIAGITKRFHFRLGYYGFLLGYILNEKKIAFALVKVFSILMLSISFVINGDHFDEDLFNLFFLLIFVAHAVLVFYCVDFYETQLSFSRNLPLSFFKIAGLYIFTFSIFLLPEAVFMLVNNHGNLPIATIITLYFTAVTTMFLCAAYLYGCGLNMESYMFLVFITFMMIFFLQKADLKLITLAGILLAGGVVFKTYYYSFERE
jgi:hypothetical protein